MNLPRRGTCPARKGLSSLGCLNPPPFGCTSTCQQTCWRPPNMQITKCEMSLPRVTYAVKPRKCDTWPTHKPKCFLSTGRLASLFDQIPLHPAPGHSYEVPHQPPHSDLRRIGQEANNYAIKRSMAALKGSFHVKFRGVFMSRNWRNRLLRSS